jgi:hypothetical protein
MSDIGQALRDLEIPAMKPPNMEAIMEAITDDKYKGEDHKCADAVTKAAHLGGLNESEVRKACGTYSQRDTDLDTIQGNLDNYAKGSPATIFGGDLEGALVRLFGEVIAKLIVEPARFLDAGDCGPPIPDDWPAPPGPHDAVYMASGEGLLVITNTPNIDTERFYVQPGNGQVTVEGGTLTMEDITGTWVREGVTSFSIKVLSAEEWESDASPDS